MASLPASLSLVTPNLEGEGVRYRLSAQTGVADHADPLAGLALGGGDVPVGCVRAGGGSLLLLGGPLVEMQGGSADPWASRGLWALSQSPATREFCILSGIYT